MNKKTIIPALMRKYFVLILFVFISASSFSQNEFKQLYESLSVNDRFSNLFNLRDYQGKYPGHAITYYLTGKIYEQYMRETNPLFLFNFVDLNHREAITNYNLAKLKIDEKQARHDREYYGDIEIITDKKKAGLTDVLYELEVRLDETDKYFQAAKSAHDNYYKCIRKYNECLYVYRDIVEGFPNYKDLYLLADESLRRGILNIKLNFDSSLVFFETYRASCEKLQHILKVNEYKLNPIITYRLEGLVEADFTRPVVELWDFSTWAENFLGVLDGDIKLIKEGIFENDISLDKQIDKLRNEEYYSDEMQYFIPSDKFKNLIGKYDYSSLCNKVFNYKSTKVEYMVKTRATINDPRDTVGEFLINRLRYFKDLAFMKEELNHEADLLKMSISIDDIGKYFQFFETRYRGMDGLKRWCEVEKYDNDNVFLKNLLNLKEFINRENQKFAYEDSIVEWKKKKLAFGIQHPDISSLKRDTLITTRFAKFKKKDHFLSGYEILKDSTLKTFTARVDENANVCWLNSITVPGKDTVKSIVPEFQQILDDSVAIVLNSVETVKKGVIKRSNYLSGYNWAGKEILFKDIESSAYPRYFYADEINENFLIISKGLQKEEDYSSIDTVNISFYDFEGKILWSNNYLLKGSVVGVVHTNSNFLITFNFDYFSDNKSKTLDSPGDNLNLLGLYITRDGKLQDINQYSYSGNLDCQISEKVTSNYINLVGEKWESGSNSGKGMFYILINPEGGIEYSTIDELKYEKHKIEK